MQSLKTPSATTGKAMFLGREERSHFFAALAVAAVVELLIVLAAAYIARRAPRAVVQPQVTIIHMVAPPKPLPPPPKPAPVIPPKPLPPPPPLPLPAPKPVPLPLPKPPPKPVPRPRQRPPVPVKPKRVVPKPVQPPVPQAPPQPPSAPVPEAVQENALEAYAAVVHDAVQADLQVPATVALMHLSGVTRIALNISPDGSLRRAEVIASSGIPMIDQAALAKVRATKFPPFSGKMPNHAITIEISVQLRSQ
jgi:protein TonB